MERVIERVAGLDVHQATVVATVRVPGSGGRRLQYTETFATTAAALVVLGDWLGSHGVTDAALESTGVYWKPVYYALESRVTLVLVNARHVTQVPGRKTDVRDSAWLAQLLECGLLRGSFVPPVAIRELRDLTRYRGALMQERTRAVNRLHKVLEDADVKLATVVSDVLGVSGRAMLHALAAGTTDPGLLAELARGTLRRKLPALRAALAGQFRAHHAFLLSQQLAHVDYLEETVATLSAAIAEHLRPFAAAVERLQTIPGVSERVAQGIVAEIGVDMTRFGSAAHLASWAGVCPGQYESGGKRKGGTPRRGNRWLRSLLHLSAQGAVRSKAAGALGARYRRILRRRGPHRALHAVAHAQLVAVYHMLAREQDYRDLGATYDDDRARQRATARAVRLLERQGFIVTPAAA